MPKGGNITLTASNKTISEQDVKANNNDISSGEFVVLTVRDTGTGIPVHLQEKIFEPFFSTKPMGSGSGLGLSMIQGFTKQSGGMVKVESRVNEGTKIDMYFPAVSGESALPEHNETEAKANISHAGKTILLVEDNIGLASTINAILKHAGFNVLVSSSGEHAIPIFNENPDIDLLLTDIVMPGSIQGTALAATIRKTHKELPIIYMSGYSENEEFWQEAPEKNAVRLIKPVNRKDLLQAINESLS
jgi:CheY-like chemotaxis protein